VTRPVRPQLLKLAREAAGLRQQDVVEALQVTQVTVSRWENGNRTPEDDHLVRLAELYQVTPEFFSLEERDAGLVAGDLHHRRRRGVKVSDVRQLEAQTNILRIGATRLLQQVDLDPVLHIPHLPAEQYTPQEAARQLRRAWGLPIGPITDLTQLLELAGVIIELGNFEVGLDGVSMWAGPWPVMHISRYAPSDRRRFTMAHELGHLGLHQDGYSDNHGEREANDFAAEFLMPAEQIRPQLRRLTLKRTVVLKLEWHASVAALILRARDVKAITPEHATRLHKQRSGLGWTKNEPYSDALPNEAPTTLARVRQVLLNNGLTEDDIAAFTCRPNRQLRIDASDEWPRLRVV
jgi:Zn-dependent peptidase ImmA (M78 family)/transcriptional regulator with XRE-family HTH domain